MAWQPLLNCTLFGILGIVLITLGFKFFDLVLTKIDVEQEVAKGNIAAAILAVGVISAITVIVAVAIF